MKQGSGKGNSQQKKGTSNRKRTSCVTHYDVLFNVASSLEVKRDLLL